MKLLLDTNVLLWYAQGILPHQAKVHIEEQRNYIYFSSASIWEIVIKNSLGRKDFQINAVELYRGLLKDECKEIRIDTHHILSVGNLPNIHKDPFDRILLAQAISENMSFLTSDAALNQYPATIILI